MSEDFGIKWPTEREKEEYYAKMRVERDELKAKADSLAKSYGEMREALEDVRDLGNCCVGKNGDWAGRGHRPGVEHHPNCRVMMALTTVPPEAKDCPKDARAEQADPCHGEAGFCEKHGRFTCPGPHPAKEDK